MAEEFLSVAGTVDLVISELPAGERWHVRGVRLQIGRLTDPLPQAGSFGRAHLCDDRRWREISGQQVLDVVQVVLNKIMVD